MTALFRFIVHRRLLLTAVFLALLVAAACCLPFTEINYDDTAYLPAASNTKAGLQLMEAEFGGGSATALYTGGTLTEMLAVKDRIAKVDGVSHVLWLDDLFLTKLSADTDLTDGEKLSYILRALEALPRRPEMGAADLWLALQDSFSEEEMTELIPLMQDLMTNGFGMDMDLGALAAMGQSGGDLMSVMAAAEESGIDVMQLIEPLGEPYVAALDGIEAEIARFYTGDAALFTILFAQGDYAAGTTRALTEIGGLPDGLRLSGNAASAYFSRQNQLTEILRTTGFLVALVLVILFLFSASWLEPVLYVLTILSAILLNMGSNPLFGQVSYLTESVACILQLALSMDYAIFLINRYKKERKQGLQAEEAMLVAMKSSFAAISASSVTTVACFVTIMFMQFQMGMDMGLVMAKGILLSLATVYFFLPGLVIYFDKGLLKSEHRTFVFGCQGLAGFTFRYRWVLAVLAVALIVPSAIYSEQNSFVYGVSASQGEKSQGLRNRAEIEAIFGPQEQLALLLPKNDEAERELTQRLAALEGVVSVNSWASTVESGYADLVPAVMQRQLLGSGGYNRVVLLLSCPEEGAEAKALLAAIRGQIQAAYGEDARYYLLGNTAAAADMEASTREDFNRISWYSILAVALIVALTFRSLLVPVILVLVIQGAVWMNMSIPRLMGNPMIFIGYMIISNILLGSTIDYAILLTANYRAARRSMGRREAVREAQRDSLHSILTSGIIFAVGGLILGLTSTFPTVELLGYAIMRGGVCAMLMTLVVLPALLAILDKPLKWLSLPDKRA